MPANENAKNSSGLKHYLAVRSFSRSLIRDGQTPAEREAGHFAFVRASQNLREELDFLGGMASAW